MEKFKIKEIIKIFDIARGTIYNWKKEGKLEIVKEGVKTYVILSDELLNDEKMIKYFENTGRTNTVNYAIQQNLNFYKSKYTETKEELDSIKNKFKTIEEQNTKLVKENLKLEENVKDLTENLLKTNKSFEELNHKMDNIVGILKKFVEEFDNNNNNNRGGLLKKLFN